MTALFIVNNSSQGVARKGSVLAPIAKRHAIEVYHINDFTALPQKVSETLQNRTSKVFIEGGDGTVQGVLSEFLRQSNITANLPKFALIAGGMTNQVAKNIGLKPALIQAALKDELSTIQIPLLNIQTRSSDSQTMQTYYGFLFSTGAVPMVTEYTKSKLHKRGIGGSLAVAGGILKGISKNNGDVLYPTPIKLQLSHPNVSLDKPHIGTVLTTLPSLILGFDPFWGTDNAPLRLTYVDEAYRGLYRNVASLWAGRKHKDRSQDGLQSWNIDRIDYEYNGPCVLDGEPIKSPSGHFTITASQALTFLQAR